MEDKSPAGYRHLSLAELLMRGKPPSEDRYKILSGDFNVEGGEVKRGWLFVPTPLARRSYFYLQLISSTQFPRKHYTIRDGVNSYLLVFTFGGKGELLYEGKSYTLEPKEGFLIDCRKIHQYRAVSNAGWDYHIIHFDGFAMPDYFSQIEQGKSVKFAFPPESQFCFLLERLFEVNVEMNGRNEMLSSCLLTNMLTEIMLTLPAWDSGEIPRRIMDVRDYIQENVRKAIALETLSKKFFISKYHLCHEFKRYIGISPNEYLITARLNKAKGLLHFADLRISEISDMTGFASLNHFFYTFKKHEGISPSEYRKQWQNNG
ncbi:MAG: AraC family transcriptional regulator [Spirochaetaceae bacterium]|jgi:AraC-like DNA-binding protein|nr:AraC family transcriptional regulator [Spirochaetaceae bacterium]